MVTTDARNARFIIVGAGMSGILAAIRLRQRGYSDVTVYEKADRVGGTWRENSYPGLTCDVTSHKYTYSFEYNPNWSSEYPSGAEILDYFESTARKHGVTDVIRFGEEVTEFAFDDGKWRIKTSKGNTDVADYIIAATGVLHHPSYPDIPGLEDFAGACFHTARWDHSVPLDGRRIGVIGNGSTGVQVVSALADRAAKVIHFQRSPQWVRKNPNRPYTPEEREAFRSDPALIDAIRNDPKAEEGSRIWSRAISDASSPEMAAIEAVVAQTFEESIADPALREKLRPDHRVACKRIVISPNYYDKIQQPTVEIVREKIERIEPTGVRTTDGVLHEMDVLALATGFRANQFLRPASATGEDGADIEELWSDRPIAYYGTALPGFPNLFMLNGPTAPIGNFSLIDVAERQLDYILTLIEEAQSRGAVQVAVRKDATDAYEDERFEAAKKTIFASGCSSWYLDSQGVPAIWPWPYDRFAEAMAAPKFDDFEFRIPANA